MNSRIFALIPAILLAVGCSSSAEPVSVLKPEADKIHVGMQAEDVKAICGNPSMSFTDPLSGSAMYIYKDEKVGDQLTVSFNMDGVAKVQYNGT